MLESDIQLDASVWTEFNSRTLMMRIPVRFQRRGARIDGDVKFGWCARSRRGHGDASGPRLRMQRCHPDGSQELNAASLRHAKGRPAAKLHKTLSKAWCRRIGTAEPAHGPQGAEPL